MLLIQFIQYIHIYSVRYNYRWLIIKFYIIIIHCHLVTVISQHYLYRCSRKRTCGMSLSIYKDTFFGSTRVSAKKVLLIAYLWLTKSLNSAMISLERVSCPKWLRNGAPDREPYRALRGPSNRSPYWWSTDGVYLEE